jgi:hypothetical protein
LRIAAPPSSSIARSASGVAHFGQKLNGIKSSYFLQ